MASSSEFHDSTDFTEFSVFEFTCVSDAADHLEQIARQHVYEHLMNIACNSHHSIVWDFTSLEENPNRDWKHAKYEFTHKRRFKPQIFLKENDILYWSHEKLEEHVNSFESMESIDAWWQISSNVYLTADFVQKHHDWAWDLYAMSSSSALCIETVKLFHEKERSTEFDWPWISRHPNITMEDIESTPDFPWNYTSVCLNPNLTVHFVKHMLQTPEYATFVNWKFIATNPSFRLEFIQSFPSKFSQNVKALKHKFTYDVNREKKRLTISKEVFEIFHHPDNIEYARDLQLFDE